MDFPRGVGRKIDQYVADALSVTGTRKPRPTSVPAVDPDPEPETQPELNEFAEEDSYAWQLPALEIDDDGRLPLPPMRAPRGSTPPPIPAFEIDDEITEVLSKPSS